MCEYSKDYKGLLPPRCNDGRGCPVCLTIYLLQTEKMFKEALRRSRES